MRVQIAKERVLPTREGEEGHGRGHADVDADHACLDTRRIIPRGFSAAGENRSRVAEWRAVHQFDGFFKSLHSHHRKHWPKDLIFCDGHLRLYAIKDGWPQEKSVAFGL